MNNGQTYRTREPKSERVFWHEVGQTLDRIEAEEARQLTASIDAASLKTGTSYQHCITGPCRGGKYLCITPEACRVAQRSGPPMVRVRLLAVVVLIVLLIAAVKWYS